jgi:Rho-binding antiterminator
MSLNKYKPIACTFHDVIEHHAVLKNLIDLCFIRKKEQITISTKIVDIFTMKGEEFITLDDGTSIRLDQIVSINKQKLNDHTC